MRLTFYYCSSIVTVCFLPNTFHEILGGFPEHAFINPLDIKKCLLKSWELQWSDLRLQRFDWQYDCVDENLLSRFTLINFDVDRISFIIKSLNQNVIDVLDSKKKKLQHLYLSYFNR